MTSLGFEVNLVSSLANAGAYDCLVFVSENFNDWPESTQKYLSIIVNAANVDVDVASGLNVFYPNDGAFSFVIYSPTGPVNRDYDDIRRYQDAALAAFTRVTKAGKKKPLLVVPKSDVFDNALLVSLFGAYEALYVPLEIREAVPERATKISQLGVLMVDDNTEDIVLKSQKLEIGRIIARDIGGSDPERMSAKNTEEYLKKALRGKNIDIKVIESHDIFKDKYPLLAAVDRCANGVERHRGRLIELEYIPHDEVKATYLYVGKGITYDTGGADVKAGGVMAGMHRDKCGAATVAGIFGALGEFQPKGIKVVGRLAMVRNSIGAESYVADEIITSAAGTRVRVGNTDAEGRMVMSDPLHYAKLQALNEINPHLFTVATLTGHSIRAVGEGYSIVLDNGAARKVNFAQNVQSVGDTLAEPFEISTIRREDFNFIAGRNEYEDVLQCNNEPSTQTSRGHQFPAAFLMRASGLDKHGLDSKHPLKYSHMDIAGSAGPYPGIPTGAPMIALCKIMNVF